MRRGDETFLIQEVWLFSLNTTNSYSIILLNYSLIVHLVSRGFDDDQKDKAASLRILAQ